MQSFTTKTLCLLAAVVITLVYCQTTAVPEGSGQEEGSWGTVPPTETPRGRGAGRGGRGRHAGRNKGMDRNSTEEVEGDGEGVHERCLMALELDMEETEFDGICPEPELRERIKERRERRREGKGKRRGGAKGFVAIDRKNRTQVDDVEGEELLDVLQGNSRRKRMVTTSGSKRWPKGIVPYKAGGDMGAIKYAMSIYERNTCIR